MFPTDSGSFIILDITAVFKWTCICLKLEINQHLVKSFEDCSD